MSGTTKANAGTGPVTCAKGKVATATTPVSPATLEAFQEAMVEHLVGRGMGRVWALALVEADSHWIAANHKTKSVAEASSEVFAPETPEKLGDFRSNVAYFLDGYGLEGDHSDAVLDKNLAVLSQAHRNKLPPWIVAAQLLHEARDVAAYAAEPRGRDEPRTGAEALELPEQATDLLEQAVRLGLLGETPDDVIKTLVQQALLGLVRDGVLCQHNGGHPPRGGVWAGA